MDSGPLLAPSLAACLALLLFISFLSMMETAVLNTRRSRLVQHQGSGARVAQVERLIEAPERFQASAHLAKSASAALLYAGAALSGLQAGAPAESPSGWIAASWPLVLAVILLAFLMVSLLGEALPKAAAAGRPERILLKWAPAANALVLAVAPPLWLMSRVGGALARSAGADPLLTSRAAHSEEEIKLLVEGSAEEGVLEEEEKEMIHSIFEFTDTVARQVMVPRIDMAAVSVDATVDEAVREVLASGHSRLPVYDGTPDRVVGVMHVKDLLPHLVQGSHEIPVRELLRQPFFIPEGKKIDELLQEFRRHKSQIAVVVDEFGGTAGVVTVEDVLEEIVGEIEDEYDVEERPAVEIAETPEGTVLDGRTTIADVNQELDLDLPTEDNDTIGGFVFSLFGRPPLVGERVAWNGLELVAESVEGLRIQRVRLIRVPPQGEKDTGPEPG